MFAESTVMQPHDASVQLANLGCEPDEYRVVVVLSTVSIGYAPDATLIGPRHRPLSARHPSSVATTNRYVLPGTACDVSTTKATSVHWAVTLPAGSAMFRPSELPNHVP